MTRQRFSAARLLAALLFAATAATLAAQQPHAPAALIADDYRRAERFLTYNTTRSCSAPASARPGSTTAGSGTW